MGTINNMPRELIPVASVPLKGYINTRDVLALTAELVSIPAGAVAVQFAATSHFVAKSGDAAVAAAWPTDLDDGTGLELNPDIRRLDGVDTHISVMLKDAG